jgi:hypothetical protein
LALFIPEMISVLQKLHDKDFIKDIGGTARLLKTLPGVERERVKFPGSWIRVILEALKGKAMSSDNVETLANELITIPFIFNTSIVRSEPGMKKK